MIVFPNSKINLGLQVLKKRKDGFHDIETLFYPVSWSDALEVVVHEDQSAPFIFTTSGTEIEGAVEDNILYKCWKIITALKKLPPLKVHLHKNIPMGAGLGGGSADAGFFINLLNDLLELNLEHFEKLEIAKSLGSDCAFFLKNTPMLAKGKGDKLSRFKLDLSEFFILLVYPGIHSNTRDAYQGLELGEHPHNLKKILKQAEFGDWSEVLLNDFEPTIFRKYPEIAKLKETLYEHGALYASLSGSGSTVFGIYKREPHIPFPANYRTYLQKPGTRIL